MPAKRVQQKGKAAKAPGAKAKVPAVPKQTQRATKKATTASRRKKTAANVPAKGDKRVEETTTLSQSSEKGSQILRLLEIYDNRHDAWMLKMEASEANNKRKEEEREAVLLKRLADVPISCREKINALAIMDARREADCRRELSLDDEENVRIEQRCETEMLLRVRKSAELRAYKEFKDAGALSPRSDPDATANHAKKPRRLSIGSQLFSECFEDGSGSGGGSCGGGRGAAGGGGGKKEDKKVEEEEEEDMRVDLFG